MNSSTVADYNPDYAGDAPVVIVVFEPALDTVDAWQHHGPADLWPLVQDHDLQTYAYPEPRLEPVGDALADPSRGAISDRDIVNTPRSAIPNVIDRTKPGLRPPEPAKNRQ